MKRIGGFGRFVAFLAALVMVALMASCSSEGDSLLPSVGDPVPAQDNAEVGLPQEDGAEDGTDSERLIIRTKTLRLEVEETTEAMEDIRELTGTYSGTVSNLQVATDSDEPLYRYNENGVPEGDGTALRAWITVRIPTDQYEDFVAAVAGLGDVKFQSEAASDVTQEHVDLSARLENLRAQEVRLREFFEAADDVEDMLAVEQELGRVRGEIESLDAQVTYLERQAAMATITVELTEPRPVVRPGGESWGFVEAITNGVRGAAALVTGLLTVLIAATPLVVAGAVVFFVVRAVMRRRRASAAPSASAGPAAPTQAGPSQERPTTSTQTRPAPPTQQRLTTRTDTPSSSEE